MNKVVHSMSMEGLCDSLLDFYILKTSLSLNQLINAYRLSNAL